MWFHRCKSEIDPQPFEVLLWIPTFVAKTRTCWQKLSDLRVQVNIGMFYQLTLLSMLILTGHAESKMLSFPNISPPCWHLNFVMKHSFCDNFCMLVSLSKALTFPYFYKTLLGFIFVSSILMFFIFSWWLLNLLFPCVKILRWGIYCLIIDYIPTVTERRTASCMKYYFHM